MYETLRELHRKFWEELSMLELATESQQHQKERSEEALAVLCAMEEDEDEN